MEENRKPDGACSFSCEQNFRRRPLSQKNMRKLFFGRCHVVGRTLICREIADELQNGGDIRHSRRSNRETLCRLHGFASNFLRETQGFPRPAPPIEAAIQTFGEHFRVHAHADTKVLGHFEKATRNDRSVEFLRRRSTKSSRSHSPTAEMMSSPKAP